MSRMRRILIGLLSCVLASSLGCAETPDGDPPDDLALLGGGKTSCNWLKRQCERGREWTCRRHQKRCEIPIFLPDGAPAADTSVDSLLAQHDAGPPAPDAQVSPDNGLTITGTRYYVGPSGDDVNPGTEAKPWRTIAKANATLKPGDAVFLRAGEYEEAIAPTLSGTAAAPIVFSAYPGEVPVITNPPKGSIHNKKVAIALDNRSYVEIRGIHIDGKKIGADANVQTWVTMHGADHILIKGCDFKHAKGWDGISIEEGAHHNRLLDNRMDAVGDWNSGTAESPVDAGNMIQIGCGSYNLIEGNHLSRGGHNLIAVHGSHNVIRRNLLENKWGPGMGNRVAALADKARYDCELGYNLFELNEVRDTLEASDSINTASMKAESFRSVVRRNLFVNGYSGAISTASRDEVPVTKEVSIYHNTMVGYSGFVWRVTLFDTGKEISGLRFVNNLAYKNRQAPPTSSFDVDLIMSSVAFHAQTAGNLLLKSQRDDAVIKTDEDNKKDLAFYQGRYPALFFGNISEEPLFVSADPSAWDDFAHKAESPAVDRGVPLTRTTASGNSTRVPVGYAGYFTNGFGLIAPDEVQVGSQVAKVVEVDYDGNALVLDRALSFAKGDPVSLPFAGSAPDIGLFERGM